MKPNIDKKRHFLKTISWRIIGTLDTLLLGWIISGSLRVGAAIGGAEMVSKMILYYMHERLWYNIDYGISGSEKRVNLDKSLPKDGG